MKFPAYCLTAALLCAAGFKALAYPLDGDAYSEIPRLEASRLEHEGVIDGPRQPPGALLGLAEVVPRLLGRAPFPIPAADPTLSAAITGMLGENAGDYGIALLDISDPNAPLYAQHRDDYRQNVGSVGKLVVALAIFQALADNWPEVAERERVLRETLITADGFAHSDHHTVRLYEPGSRSLTRRALQDGDRASLWQYLDWMLSPSSNSAAGMLMRDAMLMRHFGSDYPLPDTEIHAFFANTATSELTELYRKTFYEPLVRNGFDLQQFRQGSFFTHQGKRYVPGPGNSYANARQLIRYGLLLEQGRLVDEFSSREIKRLLYVTERRIRYASSPALNEDAVYFKSGSLYQCREETDFKCGKYMGNVINYMNSFAIVESPAPLRQRHYLVVLISNVLRKNSAYDHQALAGEIAKLIRDTHSRNDPP